MSCFNHKLERACDFVREEVEEDIDEKLVGINSTGDRCLCQITSAIDYIMTQFEILDNCVGKEEDVESAKEDFFLGKMIARIIGVYQSESKLSEYEKSILKQLKLKYAESSPTDIRAESLLYIKNFVNKVCTNVRSSFPRHIDLSPKLLILGRMKVAFEILENCMKCVRQDITLERFFSVMGKSTEEELIETVISKDPELTLRLSQSVRKNVPKNNESCCTGSDVSDVIRLILEVGYLVSR
ncbi:hypothetical protein [Ehrlichia canis]|uniref:hypothetical protein n=1 Tax=Ehrlichia canis TaxID=944 RepID=UPI00003A8418|nr:hypothetical protein [Ehrlichia canis]UKC53483.1 hypothetical protein s20019040002_000526 [Ehrlichia canis]UKC54421.1 hypothetical protein s20026770001_000527 [Ehrlichia canis]UKC55358.1 hypothetical protein s21009500007_000528 [Ehrlichia canis]